MKISRKSSIKYTFIIGRKRTFPSVDNPPWKEKINRYGCTGYRI